MNKVSALMIVVDELSLFDCGDLADAANAVSETEPADSAPSR